MADNVAITPGSGASVAADDIGGVLHQRVKISIGADGSAADLDMGREDAASALPVVLSTEDKATLDAIKDAVEDTAPVAVTGGTSHCATSVVSPSTSATTLAIARSTRSWARLVNKGTVRVYYGEATVTTSNAYLDPDEWTYWPAVTLVQGITASGTGTILVEDAY